MKNLALVMAVLCGFSSVAMAEVTVCEELQHAPSAGRVYGDYLIMSGEVSYYLDPTDAIVQKEISDATTGKKVCITGELTIIDGVVIPIAQITQITKIVY